MRLTSAPSVYTNIHKMKASLTILPHQWRAKDFFRRRGRRGSTNPVEDTGQREWGSGGGILIRLFWTYFPRTWEFGTALSNLRNVGTGGGRFEPANPLPPLRYAIVLPHFPVGTIYPHIQRRDCYFMLRHSYPSV
jgi:hypothetical protein